MTDVVQELVNTLSLGGTYALLALGLAVVFSILGLINFAHGELMTITGYTIYFLLAAGAIFPLAVVGAVAVACIAAVLMERIAFRPFRGASPMTLLMTSFAIAVIIETLYQDLISARPRAIGVPSGLSGAVSIAGQDIGVIQLIAIGATAVFLVALIIFLRATVLGLSIRAAAEDFQVTRLMGIRANRVIATAFAISGLLAGVAGFLWVSQRGTVDPLMGLTPVLKAFIASVIGGLGSLGGAVAAGFLLGFSEVTLQRFLPDSALAYRDAFVWVLLIGVLLWRPNGLFAPRSAVA
jgi:branched-chain amino acid transport system permease protein